MSIENQINKGDRLVVKCGNDSHGYIIKATVFDIYDKPGMRLFYLIDGGNIMTATVPRGNNRKNEEPKFLYSTSSIPFKYQTKYTIEELTEFSKNNPTEILVNPADRSNVELVNLSYEMSH